MDRWGGSWGLIGWAGRGARRGDLGRTQREFRMTGAGGGGLKYRKIYLDMRRCKKKVTKLSTIN